MVLASHDNVAEIFDDMSEVFPAVCYNLMSRQFVPSDYGEGKLRKLKKGAIQSIFWSLQPLGITNMKNAIRRRCSTLDSSIFPKKRKCLDTGIPQVTDATSSYILDTSLTSSECNEGAYQVQIIWTFSASTLKPQNRPASKLSDSSHANSQCCSHIKQEQAGVRKMSVEIAVGKRKWTRGITDMRKKVETFKNAVVYYKNDLESLQKLIKEYDVTNCLNICEDAKSKNMSGMFLFDQIKYYKKSPR